MKAALLSAETTPEFKDRRWMMLSGFTTVGAIRLRKAAVTPSGFELQVLFVPRIAHATDSSL